jgi:hypothetical protein
MSIDLRLSDVDPPASEPSRTIYRDINNLPDPVQLGITARYFNHDSVTLYFQLTGSATGYTFGTVNLGSLAAGTDAYQNCDQLASRAKPSASALPNGEMEETVTLTLKAYTDSGYSNLKWTFSRNVTVHWINSADPAFTVNELDNFDDGTVEGWAGQHIGDSGFTPYTISVAVATDYVLSPAYSCKLTDTSAQIGASPSNYDWIESELYKSFTTPDKSTIYAIIDARISGTASGASGISHYGKRLQILQDTTPLIYLGQTPNLVASAYFPADKWVRIVVPLPKSTTLTLRVRGAVYITFTSWGSSTQFINNIWLDDFKLLSK